MTWIGLRDDVDAVLRPSGLGQSDSGPTPDPDVVLAQGSLVIAFRHDPTDQLSDGRFERPVNVLRYARRDPTAAIVTLRIDPDGTLSLLMRQGDRDALFSLHLPPLMQFERVTVHYLWDSARRIGVFAASLPERGLFEISDLSDPLPLCWRDAAQIMTDPGRCRTHPGLEFAAIANHLVPIGPQPCLDGAGRIETPAGSRCLRDLRAGDTVIAADGERARVRWIGEAELPARGVDACHLMRSPYFGVIPDLIVSAAAVLRLTGTEVDYLFGVPEVSVAVRHLSDDIAILPMHPKPGQPRRGRSQPRLRTYHQMVLDRPVPLRVSGAVIEPLDSGVILRRPELHRWSMLADLPVELLPRFSPAPCLRLRPFEAKTLRRMQAA